MPLFSKSAKSSVSDAPKNFLEVVVEYAQALFGAIFLAVLIRGFVFEPFKIPSESMVPTLLVGDHIFVKRFAYGLRVPFTKKWLTEFDDPKRGDVVVFSFPEDEDIDFIKRVVGVPGDKVSMVAGQLFVNGGKVEGKDLLLEGKMPQDRCHMQMSKDTESLLAAGFKPYPYYKNIRSFEPELESLPGGVDHLMQRSKVMPIESDFEVTVPPRQFFVLGDNRDQSQDSRFWGFVPRENLKGRAEYIWISLNYEGVDCPSDIGFFKVRWDRFGRKII